MSKILCDYCKVDMTDEINIETLDIIHHKNYLRITWFKCYNCGQIYLINIDNDETIQLGKNLKYYRDRLKVLKEKQLKIDFFEETEKFDMSNKIMEITTSKIYKISEKLKQKHEKLKNNYSNIVYKYIVV